MQLFIHAQLAAFEDLTVGFLGTGFFDGGGVLG